MKIHHIISLLILLYFASCTTPILEDEIKESSYPNELKLIKAIINDPKILIKRDNVIGCINPTIMNTEFWTSFIEEHYTDNICSIKSVKTIEHDYTDKLNNFWWHSLEIHLELDSEIWGITFEFFLDDEKWCLGNIDHYPSLLPEPE
jgi:hypothetical protein